MTYAKLDAYRNSQVFQMIFKYYIENEERGYVNLLASNAYNVIFKEKSDNKEPSREKTKGSSKLSIVSLINKDKRGSNPKEFIQTKIILKNLIDVLYGQEVFFKKIVDERPFIIDELIEAIVQAVDELPEKQKLKSAKDLASLSLVDNDLNYLLYKLLQGTPYKIVIDKEQNQENLGIQELEEGDEREDKTSIKGYYSLLDFINGKEFPVRIFLASKELLRAIFNDPFVVENIMRTRKELYRELMNGGDSKPLSEKFKVTFNSLKDPSITDESLSYTLSKTNPKGYE